MEFTNTQIPLEDLPRYSSIVFTDLPKLYAKIILRLTLIFIAVLIVIAGIIIIAVPEVRLILAGIRGLIVVTSVLLFCGFITWFNYKSAKVISYAIRQHDIVLRVGVFWRKETVQPLKRVQHVELTQGPIDKRYGLAKVKLFSAGTAMSTYIIPGLEYQQGLRIRQFILDYHENPGQEFVSSELISIDENIV